MSILLCNFVKYNYVPENKAPSRLQRPRKGHIEREGIARRRACNGWIGWWECVILTFHLEPDGTCAAVAQWAQLVCVLRSGDVSLRDVPLVDLRAPSVVTSGST